jgi:hypothetical protein
MWRAADIGRHLGVTKQRAHQIVREAGFPAPVDEDAIGELWDGTQVRRWSSAWVKGKPWRRLIPGERWSQGTGLSQRTSGSG